MSDVRCQVDFRWSRWPEDRKTRVGVAYFSIPRRRGSPRRPHRFPRLFCHRHMDRGHRSQVAQKEKAQLATMIPKRNEFFTSALNEDDKEPFATTSHFGAELRNTFSPTLAPSIEVGILYRNRSRSASLLPCWMRWADPTHTQVGIMLKYIQS